MVSCGSEVEQVHAPEEVHIEDLVPVLEAVPRRAFRPDRGVVHEHANLREQTRERCEVIAARRIQPPLPSPIDGHAAAATTTASTTKH